MLPQDSGNVLALPCPISAPVQQTVTIAARHGPSLNGQNQSKRRVHLQGDKLIFDEDLLGEKIGTYCGLVLLSELLAHISSQFKQIQAL
jgi:hypothetical protein